MQSMYRLVSIFIFACCGPSCQQAAWALDRHFQGLFCPYNTAFAYLDSFLIGLRLTNFSLIFCRSPLQGRGRLAWSSRFAITSHQSLCRQMMPVLHKWEASRTDIKTQCFFNNQGHRCPWEEDWKMGSC